MLWIHSTGGLEVRIRSLPSLLPSGTHNVLALEELRAGCGASLAAESDSAEKEMSTDQHSPLPSLEKDCGVLMKGPGQDGCSARDSGFSFGHAEGAF